MTNNQFGDSLDTDVSGFGVRLRQFIDYVGINNKEASILAKISYTRFMQWLKSDEAPGKITDLYEFIKACCQKKNLDGNEKVMTAWVCFGADEWSPFKSTKLNSKNAVSALIFIVNFYANITRRAELEVDDIPEQKMKILFEMLVNGIEINENGFYIDETVEKTIASVIKL